MRFTLTARQWRSLERELKDIRETHEKCLKEQVKALKRLKDFEDVFEQIVRGRV